MKKPDYEKFYSLQTFHCVSKFKLRLNEIEYFQII
jgi:hypothetical protein